MAICDSNLKSTMIALPSSFSRSAHRNCECKVSDFMACVKVKRTAETDLKHLLAHTKLSSFLNFLHVIFLCSRCKFFLRVLLSRSLWHGYLFRGIRADYLLAGCFILHQIVILQVDNIINLNYIFKSTSYIFLIWLMSLHISGSY